MTADAQLALVLVSDIHAGPKSPYMELRTNPAHAAILTTPHHSIPTLAAAIEKVIASIPSKRRVLVCAGDLSSTCHAAELAQAGQALTTLADILRIPKKARLLVPGNHDIDWSMTDLAKTDPWYDKHRQRKLIDVLAEHAKTFAFPTDGRPREIPVAGNNAFFYVLDSAHEDRKNVTPHRGRLGPNQLQTLDAMLGARSDVFRCIVLHHHVIPFAPAHGVPDFSLLEDSADLLELISRHSVPFLVHGHQHVPFFMQHTTGPVPLTLVSAGSTTVSYDDLPQQVPNTFHAIIFDTLDARYPKGSVHTRMFSSTNGWQFPVLTHHRVAARRPFGAPISPALMEEWADEAIALCATEKIVHIEDYLSTKPDGMHVCPHVFRATLDSRIVAVRPKTAQETIVDALSDRVVLQWSAKGAS